MSNEPKLTKDLLSRVVDEAHRRYVANGNSDGVEYLNPRELVAKSYVQATLTILAAQGFTLTVNGSDKNDRSDKSETKETR